MGLLTDAAGKTLAAALRNLKALLIVLVVGIALWRLGFLRWPWSQEPPARQPTQVTHDSAETVAKLAPEFTEPLKKKGVDQGFIAKILEKKEEAAPTVIHTTTVLHDTLFLPGRGEFWNRWLLYSVRLENGTLTALGANAALNSVGSTQFPAPFWAKDRFLEIQSDEQGFRLFASQEKLLRWDGFHAELLAYVWPEKSFDVTVYASLAVRERVSLGPFLSTKLKGSAGIRLAF